MFVFSEWVLKSARLSVDWQLFAAIAPLITNHFWVILGPKSANIQKFCEVFKSLLPFALLFLPVKVRPNILVNRQVGSLSQLLCRAEILSYGELLCDQPSTMSEIEACQESVDIVIGVDAHLFSHLYLALAFNGMALSVWSIHLRWNVIIRLLSHCGCLQIKILQRLQTKHLDWLLRLADNLVEGVDSCSMDCRWPITRHKLNKIWVSLLLFLFAFCAVDQAEVSSQSFLFDILSVLSPKCCSARILDSSLDCSNFDRSFWIFDQELHKCIAACGVHFHVGLCLPGRVHAKFDWI